MTLQEKGRRNEALEVRANSVESDAENIPANQKPSREEIRLRAYEIYLEHGGIAGDELDD
jgi:hypothetical protein